MGVLIQRQDLRTSHEEADVIIAQQAVYAVSQGVKTVSVVCDDTTCLYCFSNTIYTGKPYMLPSDGRNYTPSRIIIKVIFWKYLKSGNDIKIIFDKYCIKSKPHYKI